MIAIYYTMFLGWMLFRAWWEKEAFDEGESKHFPKYMELLISFSFVFVIYFEPTWQKMAISLCGIASLIGSCYDHILNGVRGKPFGYKTTNILDISGMLVAIGCFVYYYTLK